MDLNDEVDARVAREIEDARDGTPVLLWFEGACVHVAAQLRQKVSTVRPLVRDALERRVDGTRLRRAQPTGERARDAYIVR